MARIKDIYAHVTDKIISELENGTRPWMQPWNAEHAAGRITRPLRHNGIPYNGINILMLWSAALDNGYAAPYWLTYKQTKDLGAQVRKGERSSLVVYANTFTRTEENTDGEQEEHKIPFLKSYSVFNAEQIDGLPEHYTALAEPVIDPVQRIEHADRFFANTGADIRHGGNRAFYQISSDFIQMPLFEAFRDAESYIATLSHETTHWTRHPSRLDRDFGRKKFGDEGYAREELVAELGSAFLSADIGITPEIRDDHAAYIGSWLKVLKEDKRAIFQAAAHATRAVDYLHSLQEQEAVTGTAA
jgi:antirestriction protein ArdC